ncbi:MAG: dimethylmenaquinone methyltransferase [Planctomycetes bacterium]|nr:dimethylmenaquinone methyltransferase [Planctomycetota bacterium]
MKTLEDAVRDDDLEMAARFNKVRIANLYDALDSLDYPNQCLDLGLKPLFIGQRGAGRALTVHGRRAPFSHDEVKGHESRISYLSVRDLVMPGCVVVIDGGGEPFAGKFGEMTSWGLHQKGAAGIVVDGFIRDFPGLVELREKTAFTVCARGTSPIEGRRRWSVESADVVIAMPGTLTSHVRVAPGDWIVAGSDGTIVVPDEIASQVLEIAEGIEQRENDMRRELAQGMDFVTASATFLRD